MLKNMFLFSGAHTQNIKHLWINTFLKNYLFKKKGKNATSLLGGNIVVLTQMV